MSNCIMTKIINKKHLINEDSHPQWRKWIYFPICNYILLLFVIPQIIGQNVSNPDLVRGESSPIVFGAITLPLGHVFVQSPKESNWLKAGFNREVFQNEKVKTESKSRCEVKLDGKKVLRIGEKTMVTLLDPIADNAAMLIEFGHAWLTDFSKKRSTTSIRMPTAVAAIRGTVFRIDCDNNQSTINVYKGMVDVSPLKEDGITPEDTTFTVEAGEKFVIVKNLEKYLEQEKKALQQFKNKEENDFNAFIERELEEFNRQLQEEKTKFKLYKSLSTQKSKIDTEITQLSEWVNWNKERDLLIK